MNALLIYPEFPDTFWSFKHALRFVHRKAAAPPLGLLTVAAMLPAEWPKRLVDANVRVLYDEDLAWADCAFISAMGLQAHAARQLAARCRQAGVRVVAGGPLCTVAHSLMAQKRAGAQIVSGGPLVADAFELIQEADHLVLGEAEASLPAFLADLEQGCAGPVYAASELPDIRSSPAPLWALADLGQYDTMSVQFSRGCPHDCDFCNITTLFGHRMRYKAAGQIIAELDGLYSQGWRRQIFVADDNLIGNTRYLKTELLPALIEWQKGRRPIPFLAQLTIKLADDPELIRMMVEAGFDAVFIGIETPDDQSLAECNKIHNTGRDMVRDIRCIQQAGLQVYGGFIVGFDHDTPDIFQRQADFIRDSSIVTAMVGLLQAPPGSRLYRRLEQEGRLTGQSSGDNVDGTTNIVPRMGLDALLRGYKTTLERLYSPECYYRRVKSFLREYGPPRASRPLAFQDIMAFFRSVVLLGVFGRERRHYWKLLLWTLFRRPRLFPLAVTLAIYGYHFRRTAEHHVP